MKGLVIKAASKVIRLQHSCVPGESGSATLEPSAAFAAKQGSATRGGGGIGFGNLNLGVFKPGCRTLVFHAG